VITTRKNRDTDERDREESYQKKAIKKYETYLHVYEKGHDKQNTIKKKNIKKIIIRRVGGKKESFAIFSINLGFFGSYFKGTFSTTLSIESTCSPRARGLMAFNRQ